MPSHRNTLRSASFLVVMIVAGAPLLRADVMYDVTIDTTALAGANGYFDFQFLEGGNPLGNVATISNFATTGTLGVGSPSGDVTGTLTPGPLTLTADQFFNDWFQAVTFASGHTTFRLDLTTNFTLGATPDSFALVLDDSSGNPFPSTDPTGAGALFSIDLAGVNTSPAEYTSASGVTYTVTPENATVPEPGSFALLFTAIALASTVRQFPGRRSGR